MTATVVASVDANPPSEQFQAVSLWTFVHLKTPRFTSEAALDVVRHLMPTADEDPKHLAKRLRKSLLEHGIALKHVNSLDAAARLLGQADWHAANRAQPKTTLKLTPMADAAEELFVDWRQLAPRLCAWCDAWLREKGGKVFEVRFGPGCHVGAVLAAIDFVIPGVEIIDSRYRDFKFDLKSVIADNTSASRFVVGGRARNADELDLRTLGVVLEKNGEIVAMAAGAAVMGHPAAAIAALANHLGARGQEIPAGTFIMTGGVTEAIAVKAGDSVNVRFQDLGTVGMRFV